jgi:prepilin-type N-terminal cleavage/methylation domain-containing protein
VRNHRRGFTLFEMVVTVAVIAVVAAIAVPSLSSMYGDTPQVAAADKIKGAWAEAKARASAENRAYRFAVVLNTGKFRVAPDSPEYWDGSTPSDQPALVIDDVLPTEVQFSAGPAPEAGEQAATPAGDWACPVVFQSDGTPREELTIGLTPPGGGRPLLVHLRTTGSVTTTR